MWQCDMQNLYHTSVTNSVSGIQVHGYPTFGLIAYILKILAKLASTTIIIN